MQKKTGFKLILLMVLIFIAGLTAGYGQSGINWKGLAKAQELAKEEGKKVMIFAEAKWCGYCKKMYKEVFPKTSVQDSLAKYFYSVKLDIESSNNIEFNDQKMSERQLAREFRVTSTPTFIFLDSEGNILGGQPGFLPAHIFDKLVAFVGMDLTGQRSFKSYLEQHGVEVSGS